MTPPHKSRYQLPSCILLCRFCGLGCFNYSFRIDSAVRLRGGGNRSGIPRSEALVIAVNPFLMPSMVPGRRQLMPRTKEDEGLLLLTTTFRRAVVPPAHSLPRARDRSRYSPVRSPQPIPAAPILFLMGPKAVPRRRVVGHM